MEPIIKAAEQGEKGFYVAQGLDQMKELLDYRQDCLFIGIPRNSFF